MQILKYLLNVTYLAFTCLHCFNANYANHLCSEREHCVFSYYCAFRIACLKVHLEPYPFLDFCSLFVHAVLFSAQLLDSDNIFLFVYS